MGDLPPVVFATTAAVLAVLVFAQKLIVNELVVSKLSLGGLPWSVESFVPSKFHPSPILAATRSVAAMAPFDVPCAGLAVLSPACGAGPSGGELTCHTPL